MSKEYTRLTGKMATLQHSSKLSKLVLETLESGNSNFSNLSDSDVSLFAHELDDFMHDVWLQIGDTEFNRSGLRNVTDSLIDFFEQKGYYST